MSTSTVRPLKILLVVAGGINKVAPITQYSYHHFARVHEPANHDIHGSGHVLGTGEKPFMTEAFTSPSGRYTFLAEQFIREADGILLVYSVTSKYSFRQVEDQYAMIERVRTGEDSRQRFFRGRRVPLMPLLLVGIEPGSIVPRAVTKRQGANFARKLGMEFIELAETWDSPVETLFYDIVRAIDSHTQQMGDPSKPLHSAGTAAAQQIRTAFGCCIRFVVCRLQSAIRSCRRKAPVKVIDRLCNAISADQQDTVQRLVRSGVDVNAFDQHGSAPLHIAVAQNRMEIVRLLLRNGALVDRISPLNGTALSIAASQGNDEIVQILLDYGAGVDIPCDYYGGMLQAVARRDDPNILQHLDKRIGWQPYNKN